MKKLIVALAAVAALAVGYACSQHENTTAPTPNKADVIDVTPDNSSAPPKDTDPPKKDPPPVDMTLPKPELTEDGLVYAIEFERGNGSVTLARQNGLLRADFDIRLPYSAGDAGRSRGSSVDLMLSVDGRHGRHLTYYPAPLWEPAGQVLSGYRIEISFGKDQRPQRLQGDPSFAGKGRYGGWDSWQATMYVDLRRVLIPGNSPGEVAETWHFGLAMGNEAATVVFPGGLDPQNPANTPDRMLTFEFSKLPELDELDDNPREELIAAEAAMHEHQKYVVAQITVNNLKGAFDRVVEVKNKHPDALWAHFLAFRISQIAAQRGVPDIDYDYLPMQKDYVDAALGQSSAHIQYLENLLAARRFDEAAAHAKRVFESPLSTGRPATGDHMRLNWAKLCLAKGYPQAALQQFNELEPRAVKSTDDNLRIDYRFNHAQAAQRVGDSALAIKLYEAIIEKESAHLNPRQLEQIQQMLQFQRQAIEQWADELKYQAEDAAKTNPRWIIETSEGRIVVELFEDDAPNTVNALVKLANDKFYDGLNFHRVIEDFMAQGGCPKGDGTGSPGWRLKSEISRRNHFRGTVAMARSNDPHSQGSQFYICTSNGPNVINLSGSYVVVGRVLEGMDVADKLMVGSKIKSIRAENLRDHVYEPDTMPE